MPHSRQRAIPTPTSPGSLAAYLDTVPVKPERNHRLSLTGRRSFVAFCRCDVEAEHHPAFVMLGHMAVSHPPAWIRHVEQDVNGLAGAHEDGVLPDEVRLDDLVTREDQEPPC